MVRTGVCKMSEQEPTKPEEPQIDPALMMGKEFIEKYKIGNSGYNGSFLSCKLDISGSFVLTSGLFFLNKINYKT